MSGVREGICQGVGGVEGRHGKGRTNRYDEECGSEGRVRGQVLRVVGRPVEVDVYSGQGVVGVSLGNKDWEWCLRDT